MPDFAGLYVHVPFCKSKCPYCDFFSIVAPDRQTDYLEDIQREAQLYAQSFGPFDSLYVGGGTPSALTSEQLTELIAALRTGFSFEENSARQTEVTVELNPADVNSNLLAGLQQAGVNRLSLGAQSFDDAELRLLGRRHDRATALHAIEKIQKAAFASLGMDLIYGLPGASVEKWRRNLERALSLNPEHLSCYGLTVATETPFGELHAQGKLELPDEKLGAALFEETCRVLNMAGFEHYEVSNFARRKEFRSRHNQKYWQRVPYLGLGPAAHSFDGQNRWWNFSNLDDYRKAIQSGLRPVESFEEIDNEKARLESIALGMRTSHGVALELVLSRPDADEQVDLLLNQGLAFVERARLCPSQKGFLVADGIAKLFC
ncbi:MAG: radical SAM family heme chaperone HemW [Deltaproteobacteria bacterium]|nr:radical SAM family heme chaperone HemW [Deltaproteobacteria bacterium]